MEQSFPALKRFARSPRKFAERCDLCGIALAPEHAHLIEPKNRQISCACQPCALLFTNQTDGRFKRVPHEAKFLTDFRISDAQWSNLLLPIELAFFFKSSPQQRVIALYPSPAGATESLLPLEAWNEIERENPVLQNMEADTEALLVNRVGEARDHFLAPIDKCFELVGLIRLKWTGLSGGAEVWNGIGKFFENLKANSRVIGEVKNA